MVYVVGTIGFVIGFMLGQMLLLFMLRDVKSEDLVEDSGIKWKYGTLNWIIAILSTYGMVEMYKFYFETTL